MKSAHPNSPQTRVPVGRPKDTSKGEGIIRAASILFLKDGYELTSVEAVAKKAGVSKLTIYSHFANKEELFRAVIQQRCDKRAMPECFMSMADMPAEKALMRIAGNLGPLIFSPESIRLQRIMQAEAQRHPKVVRIFYEAGPQRVREAFMELLEEWNRRKELSIPDVPKATEQFFSLLKGERLLQVMMLRASQPTTEEMERHINATVSFFLSAYRPKSKPETSAP